ncbi:RICIN domain-containing protein [Streptomyces sp. NPDC051133]|uniref:RICIN domain-containing protein n=1 Tax=Streptomyces sp. NPDC051133 TaxID=3155521 RepID=UPI00342CDC3D
MAAAAAAMFMSASHAAADVDVSTGGPSDDWVLDQHSNSQMDGGGSASGRIATDYCEKVGIGTGDGQCQLRRFAEESRSVEPDYRIRISDPIRNNCSITSQSFNQGWSTTTTATNTTGFDLTVNASVTFAYAPGGVGGSATLGASATYHTSYSWGKSSTVSEQDNLNIQPGYKGWFEDNRDHGTAHGVAEVYVSSVNPSQASSGMTAGLYWIVTDIKGDLPDTSEESNNHRAEVTVPMEHSELVHQCPDTHQQVEPLVPPNSPYVTPPPFNQAVNDNGSAFGQISSAIDNGKWCLDVPNGIASDGTLPQVIECNGLKGQQWSMIIDEVRQTTTIQAFGRCLQPQGGATDRAIVELRVCNNSAAQSWTYSAASGTIVNTASGECLDIPNSKLPNSIAIIYPCNNDPNQKWTAPSGVAPPGS